MDVAVLTNGADDQQREKIAAVGLSHLVGAVFSSDVIGAAKPDLRAFQLVCARLGRQPSTIAHVGDRYDHDVVAARAAGLAAVIWTVAVADRKMTRNASRICSMSCASPRSRRVTRR